MRPSQLFRHCPRCGQPQADPLPDRVFDCAGCGFRFFFSASNAVAVFVWREEDRRALFIRRAKDPGKGRLAPPGGFIDIGETAEEAARREIREEVGLELDAPSFICSHPNTYPYAGVTYPVLDLFFSARAVDPSKATALDDVDGFHWLDPLEVNPADMAFPSMQEALRRWQDALRRAVPPCLGS